MIVSNRHTKGICALIFATIAATALTGCDTSSAGRSFKLHENIVTVPRFYNKENPWINFEDPPTDEPQGIKIVLYMQSPDQKLGIYGDGTIVANIYDVEKTSGGPEKRTHLKQWAFDPDQAAIFHGKRSRLGQPYFLVLAWPELNLVGKEILIAISFQRKDGRLVKARPVHIRVPGPAR